MQAIEEKYPHLFRAETWPSGPTTVHFRVFSSPPPERLISNVNFVPFVDDRCVIIRLDSGMWEIPGGTLEPDEHYLDTVRRELMEEAGATILTYHVVGGWECISSSPKQVFTDYHELIEKSGVQALIVATPDDVHHPVTMVALDAGLHVLCEKPMALNVQQAREMAEKATSAGVKHMILFTYRWMPHGRYLHQLVEEGFLGPCLHCHFQWYAGYGYGGNYQWKWDRQHGLGILGDLGAHIIDLAHWCVGDITQVSANLKSFVERPGPEGQSFDPSNDAAMLLLQFANGAQGSIQVSAVAHMADRFMEQRFVLCGENGTLEVEAPLNGKYVIRGARRDEDQFETLTIPESILQGVDPETPPMDHMDQVFTEQSAGSRTFIDAILNDQPISPNFHDGLKVQEVIDAAMEADQRGCWVRV